jgi:hypothetical protein
MFYGFTGITSKSISAGIWRISPMKIAIRWLHIPRNEMARRPFNDSTVQWFNEGPAWCTALLLAGICGVIGDGPKRDGEGGRDAQPFD